jgi:YHS domain-containing protein
VNDLIEFAKCIEGELRSASREPHWDASEAERYMIDIGSRRKLFMDRASQLAATIIQPRLEVLCSYFTNAGRARDEQPFHFAYWFGFTERFPASTKLTLAVEHDMRFEKIIVAYSAAMVPQFIKLNERDRLTLPLDGAADPVVADWVEARLLEFLDGYMRIDRGGEDFADESVTDPVCGMRIGRSTATASASFSGHPYFFCSRTCEERFTADPAEFVKIRAL